jgi:hypothetical protein
MGTPLDEPANLNRVATTEKTGGAENLRPWKPGQSGNPGGRPKGLASAVRAVAPPEQLAKFYLAVYLAGTDESLLNDELRAILGTSKVTLRDRLQAADWLTERGYGKAPTHAPVSGEDPLELSGIESAIGAAVDELARKREATPVGKPANGTLADTG